MQAIGDYCSYCEMPTSMGVEHVLPWDGKHTTLKTEWTNFLLFCSLCNNNKRSRQDSTPYGDPATARARYLWPDTDNTARAFVCLPSWDVQVAPALAAPADQLAKDTHWMFGFEKIDRRWKKRKQAWTVAERTKQNLATNPGNAAMLDQAKLTIEGYGFWSVWRAVFAGDAAMLALINSVFKGTDPSSFDASSAPIARPGGQL
jgi:hypothetical protein